MSVLDCHKGYWHQQLDEKSSYLTAFNTEFGRYRYTVMPFGATVAGDVFQHKRDECFGHIPNIIVIADDIMIMGKKPDHKDHDQALTSLLETARHCNMRLNYENSNTSSWKLNSLEKLIWWMGAIQPKAKYKLLFKCQHQAAKRKYNLSLG